MRHLFAFCALLALAGCDSQTSGLDGASAVIYIDGERAEASATLSTEHLNGRAYEVVSLEMTDGSRIEILGKSFEVGLFERHDGENTSFPFVFSYLERGERPRAYMGRIGSIKIGVAAEAAITGEFEFQTIDALSSCTNCEDATGPRVRGEFNAMRGAS